MQDRVTYHTGLDFKKEEGDLVLIDEVDFFALNDPEETNKLLGMTNTVGFSATVSNTKFE